MTESNTDVLDVLIVGYGPVGETAALLLGHAGLRVEVIEEQTDIFHLPRAAACGSEAMRVLQKVGVAAQVEAISAPMDSVEYLGADGVSLGGRSFTGLETDSGWHTTYMWYQPEFDRALRGGVERYPNVTVRLGDRVTHVEDDGEVVTAHTESPDGTKAASRARFVLGCDGARSLIRSTMGSELVDHLDDEEWLVIDAFLPTDPGEAPKVVEYCDPTRPATWIICEGRHRRWEFLVMPGETREELEAPERVRELIAPWVDAAEVEIVRATVYSFHALLADRYRQNRLLIAGDAAHQIPPFLGQGLVSGIRDVANLAWKLDMVIRGQAGDALLDSYQQERHPHFETILGFTGFLKSVISTTDPVAAVERDKNFADMKARGESPFDKDLVMPHLVGGVLDPDGSPSTGEIFPQHWITDDGARVRFDDAAGDGFLLVAPSGFALDLDQSVLATFVGRPVAVLGSPSDSDHAAMLAAGGWKVLVDEAGELTSWLEGHGAALVRPDRYVYGTVATPGEAPRLLDALAAHLGVSQ